MGSTCNPGNVKGLLVEPHGWVLQVTLEIEKVSWENPQSWLYMQPLESKRVFSGTPLVGSTCNPWNTKGFLVELPGWVLDETLGIIKCFLVEPHG